MAREYFLAYHSYLKSIEPLNDAERGRLFTACLEYSRTGAEPDLRGNERFIFPTIQQQIDRDREAYNKKCEKNRDNGAKGGQTNASGRYQSLPNAPQTPPKEKEKEKEKEKAKEKRTKPRGRAGGVFEDYAGEDADLLAALRSFDAMRQKSKKPMTDRARQLLLTELDKLAGDNLTKIALLDQSVMYGWMSVYPLKSSQQPAKPQGGGNPFLEMLREEGQRG